jgi:hypothetical protein
LPKLIGGDTSTTITRGNTDILTLDVDASFNIIFGGSTFDTRFLTLFNNGGTNPNAFAGFLDNAGFIKWTMVFENKYYKVKAIKFD